MDQFDNRDQELSALRERLARPGEASLRINESLEFDAVLQGVLDSARYGSLILAVVGQLDRPAGTRGPSDSGVGTSDTQRV